MGGGVDSVGRGADSVGGGVDSVGGGDEQGAREVERVGPREVEGACDIEASRGARNVASGCNVASRCNRSGGGADASESAGAAFGWGGGTAFGFC